MLTCDLSFTCEKVWERVRDLEPKLSKESLGFDFLITLQDKQESFSFNLYFHLSFDVRKFPALIYLDLKSDTARAGDLKRYVQYTSYGKARIIVDFSVESLTAFKASLEKE